MNYSKWDNIEISDDEDVEVHPNVDKRSFIRWKQQSIHQKRLELRQAITQLQNRIKLNANLLNQMNKLTDNIQNIGTGRDSFLEYLSQLLEKQQVSDPNNKNEENNKDFDLEKETNKAMLNLIKHIYSKLDNSNCKDKKELIDLLNKERINIEQHNKNCEQELDVKLKEQNKKLTSENICKPGFDSTIINKDNNRSKKNRKEKDQQIEVINQDSLDRKDENVHNEQSNSISDENEEDISVSDLALRFSNINSYKDSLKFISEYPEVVDDNIADEILMRAFEVQIEAINNNSHDSKLARQCVKQATVIQYCTKLGKDGVNLFFKKMNEKGLKMLEEEVDATYNRIKERSKVLKEQREQDKEQKAYYQLQGDDNNIKVDVPSEEEGDRYKAFMSMDVEIREALKTGKMKNINKVLEKINEQEAEQLLQFWQENKFVELTILENEQQLEEVEFPSNTEKQQN